MPGSSMPLATLGTFILWLGWFGFNGASQLAMGTISDVTDISRIFANTNLAAAAGVVVAMLLTQLLYKKVDVTMALNGALAGLVAITAEPLTPSVPAAILVGGIGAAIVVFAVPLLDKLKIDDVVGAIPVHLLAGIWGTIIVPFTNPDATFMARSSSDTSRSASSPSSCPASCGSSSRRPSVSAQAKRKRKWAWTRPKSASKPTRNSLAAEAAGEPRGRTKPPPSSVPAIDPVVMFIITPTGPVF